MRKIAFLKNSDERVRRATLYQSSDGAYLYLYADVTDGPCTSDSWYEALEQAEADCRASYGIEAGDWRPIPDPPAGCQHDWIAPTTVEQDADGNRTYVTQPTRVVGDFNGLFGDLLCLSHSETVTTDSGEPMALFEGLEIIAYEPDIDDDGSPIFLVARGVVTASPPELVHAGSRWSLVVDEKGMRHVANLDEV